MSLAQTQITVPTANNTKLCAARSARRGLVFKNHDASNPVAIGSSSVTLTGAAGGVLLKPGDIWVIADATGTLACEEFWAIAGTGAVIVGVLEQIY